jgi:non-ribosomal peptide synthetase component E (peptide arylation enzyme)
VEVENLLYTHPKIAGATIGAVPDPRLGERACAVAIPRAGQPITREEITAHLERRELARQKCPERSEVVSEFPMNPSGKIQKYKLRELIAERARPR